MIRYDDMIWDDNDNDNDLVMRWCDSGMIW